MTTMRRSTRVAREEATRALADAKSAVQHSKVSLAASKDTARKAQTKARKTLATVADKLTGRARRRRVKRAKIAAVAGLAVAAVATGVVAARKRKKAK